MEDVVLEKLRKINQKISTYKQLVKEDPNELRQRAELLESEMDSDAMCFVTVNTNKIAAPRSLEKYLQLEEIYEKLDKLQGKHPVRALQRLLPKKLELLKTVMGRKR